MIIKKWLQPYIDEQGLAEIEKSVQEAEKNTSGELVPIVVRKSSTVGHVPIILLLSLTLLFFIFEIDYWQMEYVSLPHTLMILIDFAVLILLVKLLSPLAVVERLLTSKMDQRSQVEQRAINEFHNLNLTQTRDATGILIFVSLMERQAVVLGDQAIAKRLEPEVWQNVVDQLIQGVKEKNLSSGFCRAIDMSAGLLSEHFPIKPDDENELKNHLVIKE